MKLVYARGDQIYAAAVAGAKRGHNRSTDNYSVYEKRIRDLYEFHLSKSTRNQRRRVNKFTGSDWRRAYLPVVFYKYHNPIAMSPSETHARVVLRGDIDTVLDIPLEFYERFEQQTTELIPQSMLQELTQC